MKRIVRVVWISVLTGMAFLVACTCHNRISKQEKKELLDKRSAIVEKLHQYKTDEYIRWEANLLNPTSDMSISQRIEDLKVLSKDNSEEIELRQQLQEIDSILNDTVSMKQNRQGLTTAMGKQRFIRKAMEEAIPPCVYGPPEIMGARKQDTEEPIQTEEEQRLDEEQQRLNDILQKKEARRRRDSIRQARSSREGGCVYGPPPQYDMQRKKQEAIQKRTKELESALDSINVLIQRREGACVYGSPEIIEAYNKKTSRLKEEAQRIHKELFELKNEGKKNRPL